MDAGERRAMLTRQDAALSVYSYGPPPGPGVPAIVFVHGYPDDHAVFAPVIAELSVDHHVIAYDTRNAGASRAARERLDSYRLPALVDDLFAVIDASSAGPVHLVGHDWGSIQGWAAIQNARAEGRILSFTSISGPDLGHLRRWMRHRLHHLALWPQALAQVLRSSYVAVFQLPMLPELAWRMFLTRRYERLSGRRIGDNAIRGLALYRANWLRAQQLPGRCTVPVQVIVPQRDPFLSPLLVDGLQDWVPQLKIVDVNAGHWWPAEEAQSFALLLRKWIAQTPGPSAPQAKKRR
ncbi:alpha/beta fold hydrolase [Arthrobacter sp. GCM10027362]|uniref:alpha/beta fold hydrolase n=1 Tax=Arthrobacter sp. GCM10027362 TaxID=3273379 RepID=UPI003624E7B9